MADGLTAGRHGGVGHLRWARSTADAPPIAGLSGAAPAGADLLGTGPAGTGPAGTGRAGTNGAAPLLRGDHDERPVRPVVFRAMWQDDRAGLHGAAASAFRGWAADVHPGLGHAGIAGRHAPLPAQRRADGPGSSDHRRSTAQASTASKAQASTASTAQASTDSTVELRRETSVKRGITETMLEVEQESPFADYTVRLRVLSDDRERWLWVDVEMPSEQAAAPSSTGVHDLVYKLLLDSENAGGRPRLAKDYLSVRPALVNPGHDSIVGVANLIRHPARRLPYVFLADDVKDGPAATIGRAQSAAHQLAGFARVFLLSNLEAINQFQVVMGADLSLEPGSARLFLPGEHEVHRHRSLEPNVVRSSPDEAGRWFARLLQSMAVTREPPLLYERIVSTAGQRRSRTGRAAASNDADRAAALDAELEDVWETLHETRAQCARARGQRDEIEAQLVDALDELEMVQHRVETLQEMLENSQRQTVAALLAAGAATSPRGAPQTKYPQITSIRQALELARANLTRVVIPPEAERRIEDLDNAIESRAWARSVFDGLLAFEAYAHRTDDQPYGDFREWCRRSGHARVWYANAKKLAMRESEEVMRHDELRRHRCLPVSTRVAPVGWICMEAHLKLANGSLAPRLYFYDDSRGGTGKVHVGFLGPHRLMPTKRDRK